jgi:hypothetical protein
MEDEVWIGALVFFFGFGLMPESMPVALFFKIVYASRLACQQA